EFKSNPVISKLQSLNSRSVATGYNLFQPNTNLVYGIDDFRTTAPLYPRRYARFQKLGGGGGRFFTIPDQSTELSKVFDLAAVRYVLSDRMISSAEESPPQFAQDYHPAVELPVKLADGLRLENASFAYDAKRKVLLGMAKFSLHKSAQTHYDCALAIADENGKSLVPLRWLSERIEENSTPQGNHSFVKQFAMPVPNGLEPGRKLQAALFIRNNWNSEMLGIGKSTAEQGLSLGSFSVGESLNLNEEVSSDTNNAPSEGSHLFVRHSDLPEGLFLFENKNALPPAYLIHKAELAADEKASLKCLAEKKLDYSSTAVIECDPQYALAQGLSEPSLADKSRELAKIISLSDDKVSVETLAATPAFLILTHTYFPGWEATVDGHPAKILPANHMFRAVAVPAGKHQVEFVYKPASFAWGCRLLLSGLILLAGLLLKSALPFLSKSNAAQGSDLQNQNSALETQSEVTQGR
ncbi:MAG: YfhO family protein, partial [Candidatus Obscuribacterales bacterium]|nr:YfhO family protein [Candidatus Obscuribacterales bacterium]